MPLSNEKCFRTVINVAIAISAITAAIGLYVGLALNDIVTLAATLVVTELIVAIVVDVSGAFKDRLSEEEQKLAKSLDVKKLKKAIIMS